MSKSRTHHTSFLPNGRAVVTCGRTMTETLTISADVREVDCKSCQRTHLAATDYAPSEPTTELREESTNLDVVHTANTRGQELPCGAPRAGANKQNAGWAITCPACREHDGLPHLSSFPAPVEPTSTTDANVNELWTMPSSPSRLHQLAQRVGDKAGSMDALLLIDYLTEIQNEAEALKRLAITTARDQGQPWHMIAAQMGVSKQAAQQKYKP